MRIEARPGVAHGVLRSDIVLWEGPEDLAEQVWYEMFRATGEAQFRVGSPPAPKKTEDSRKPFPLSIRQLQAVCNNLNERTDPKSAGAAHLVETAIQWVRQRIAESEG